MNLSVDFNLITLFILQKNKVIRLYNYINYLITKDLKQDKVSKNDVEPP